VVEHGRVGLLQLLNRRVVFTKGTKENGNGIPTRVTKTPMELTEVMPATATEQRVIKIGTAELAALLQGCAVQVENAWLIPSPALVALAKPVAHGFSFVPIAPVPVRR
jgi:hypothetical protein